MTRLHAPDVCERWRESYQMFVEDIGRRPSASHSLGRFPDNSGRFEPGNVRWATRQQWKDSRQSTATPIPQGSKFGRLTVLRAGVPHRDASGGEKLRATSECVCECGTTLTVPNTALQTQNTKSCGCLKVAEAIPIGSVFGRLTVLRSGPRVVNRKDGYTSATWCCLCQCGNEVNVTGPELKRGRVISCGCWQRRQNCDSRSPEYKSWGGMLERCYNSENKSFANYGGRGITVCQRWRDSYQAFLEDMGRRPTKRHSLDRFPDTNGNYEPSNCRWATASEQANNRRSNRLIEFRGEVRTLAQWAYAVGFSHGTIHSRLKMGWTPEAALTTAPASNYRNQRRHRKE